MKLYISTDDLDKVIHKAVEKAVNESLPSAIRKGTRKKWLRTSEVMEILQLSRRSIQKLRDTGRLPFTQNRRTVRYSIDDVEAYLNRGRVNTIKEE